MLISYTSFLDKNFKKLARRERSCNLAKKIIAFSVVATVLLFLINIIESFERANRLPLNSTDLSIRIEQSYLLDDSANLKVEQVIELFGQFEQVPLNTAPTTFGPQNYWYKLDISNLTYKHRPLSILFDNPMVDYIDVYELQEGGYRKVKVLGDKRLENSREEIALPSYEFELTELEDIQILIKTRTDGAANLPMAVFQTEDYIEYKNAIYLIWGAFIGVSLLIAVYNLILYVGVRDKAYLLYIGYVIVFLLELGVVHGYLVYLTPISLFDFLSTKIISVNFLIGYFSLMFAYYFLQFDKESDSFLAKLATWVSRYYLIGALVSLFIVEYITAPIFFVSQMILYVIAISFMIKRVKQRTKWATYYVLSWLPLFAGAAIGPMLVTGNFEYDFWARHALLFGVLFEMTFISMALAERLRKIEQEKEYHSTHDAIFGLANSNKLEQAFNHLIVQPNPNFSLLVFNIANYESIVPYIQRQQLKRIIRQFAKEIELEMSSGLLVKEIEASSELSRLVMIRDGIFGLLVSSTDQHLLQSVVGQFAAKQPLNYQQGKVSINFNCYVGVAFFADQVNHSQDLVNRGLQAIELARENGLHYGFYDQETHVENQRKAMLAADLMKGLQAEQFYLVYQPQVELKTKRVSGCEVLLRWVHPKFGFVSPAEFINIAESAGVVNKLTEWVFEQTCLQVKYNLSKIDNFITSINISVHDVMTPGFISFLIRTLNRYELKADTFLLELTETAGVEDSVRFTENMLELKDLGFHLAIDDFGTGYSSLTYLSKHPFNELKIDREFIMFLSQSRKDQTIVEATITMAKSLNLELVAEGVEDAKALAMLTALGCDKVQGYFLAKPMKLEQMLTWIEEFEYPQLNQH